jgi:hypothetical protein
MTRSSPDKVEARSLFELVVARTARGREHLGSNQTCRTALVAWAARDDAQSCNRREETRNLFALRAGGSFTASLPLTMPSNLLLGEGERPGAKFARWFISEIVAVDMPVDEIVVNQRSQEPSRFAWA